MIIKQKFREARTMPETAMVNYIAYMERGTYSLLDNPIDESGEMVRYKFNKMTPLKNVDEKDIREDFELQRTIFSKEGSDVENLKKELLSAKGNIWIPIISFKEQEALDAGLDSQVKFRNKARQFVKLFSEASNIPLDNLNYLAVMHQLEPEKQKIGKDSGAQPHLHFIIWENDDLQKMGKLDKEQLLQLASQTKKLFIKQDLTDLEKKTLLDADERSISAEVSDIKRDLFNVINSDGGTREIKMPIIKAKLKDLIVQKSELESILGEGEESTIEQELKLTRVSEDIETITKGISDLNKLASIITDENNKKVNEQVIDALLGASSLHLTNEKVGKMLVTAINSQEVSSIELEKNPIVALSATIQDIANRITESDDVDPAEIKDFVQALEELMSLERPTQNNDLEGVIESRFALEKVSEVRQLMSDIMKESPELISDMILDYEYLSKVEEGISISNDIHSDKFSLAAKVAEKNLLMDLENIKINNPEVREQILGLQITYVEQNELMLDISEKLEKEFADMPFIRSSIEDLRRIMLEVEPLSLEIKENLTRDDLMKLEAQKERHMSLSNDVKVIFKDAQPEFTTREWALIETKWNTESVIESVNKLNDILDIDSPEIKELRHFKFEKDYERNLFQKQIRARTGEVMEDVDKIKERISELKEEIKESLKDIEKKDIAPTLGVNEEQLKLDESIKEKVELVKRADEMLREVEKKTQIAVSVNKINKEVDQEKEVMDWEDKQIKLDPLPEYIYIGNKEVAPPEKKLQIEVMEKLKEIQDEKKLQEIEAAEEKLEEMREAYRQIFEQAELEAELEREEQEQLYYMLMQIEIMLRMNPAAIREDMRQFALANNLEVPTNDRMDAMMKDIQDNNRTLTRSQESKLNDWLPEITSDFYEPYNYIVQEFPDLSRDVYYEIAKDADYQPFISDEKKYDLSMDWVNDEDRNKLGIRCWEDVKEILPDVAKVLDDDLVVSIPPFPLETAQDWKDYIDYLKDPSSGTFDKMFEGYSLDEIERVWGE